jgi:hypothetical protein
VRPASFLGTNKHIKHGSEDTTNTAQMFTSGQVIRLKIIFIPAPSEEGLRKENWVYVDSTIDDQGMSNQSFQISK